MTLKELLEKVKGKDDALFADLTKAIKEELEDKLSEAVNKRLEIEKQISQLTKDKDRAAEDLKELLPFKKLKDLNPERLEEYKKVDEILNEKKADLEKIKESYDKRIAEMKKTYDDELTTTKSKLEETTGSFKNFRRDNAILGSIANQIKREFKPELVLNAIRDKFELQDDGSLKFKDQEFNVKTNKLTTLDEAITILREGDFKGFFSDQKAPGGGAPGSGDNHQNSIDLSDSKKAWNAMLEA